MTILFKKEIDMTKYTLKIEGMACSMCEAHINDAIRKAVPSAKKVSSSHKKNMSTFVSDNEIDEEKLINAIKETGYDFISLSKEEAKKSGLFGR